MKKVRQVLWEHLPVFVVPLLLAYAGWVVFINGDGWLALPLVIASVYGVLVYIEARGKA